MDYTSKARVKGLKMGHIRQRELKNRGTRYQAEVRLKGHPTLTAMFDRKTDAKAWIQKTRKQISAVADISSTPKANVIASKKQ